MNSKSSCGCLRVAIGACTVIAGNGAGHDAIYHHDDQTPIAATQLLKTHESTTKYKHHHKR